MGNKTTAQDCIVESRLSDRQSWVYFDMALNWEPVFMGCGVWIV